MPVWATVFGRLSGGKTTMREVAGVALGLGGVLVLNLGGDLRANSWYAIVGLLAPMGWGLGSIASQRLPLPQGLMRTGTQMLAGGVAMVLVSRALGETVTAPTAKATFALAYLAVFGSLVGFTAYSYLLANTRPAVATSYAYVNPVIAVVLGVVFAGERFGVESAVGATVILAAVALVQKRGGKAPAATATPGAPEDSTRPLPSPAPRAPA
jgi:drug/metabolite transporter (DMT)-like permease